MKVFVAGATGAIGRPLISALLRAGHEAVGMTSSESGVQILRERGADSVVANALDAEAVQSAIMRIKPDAVIEELTSLPKRYTPEEMRLAAERDHRVRLEGGANVHNAARAAGVKRYIVQSTGFFYAPGRGLAEETAPLALSATPGSQQMSGPTLKLRDGCLVVPNRRELRCVMDSFTAPELITTGTVGAFPNRCGNRCTLSSALEAACFRLCISKMLQAQR